MSCVAMPLSPLMFEAEVRDAQAPADALGEQPVPEKLLVCVGCGAPITREAARTTHRGGHAHSFFNPHGIVYHIGCFAEAPGCRAVGPPSNEFSWFPGYHWRIVACGGCGVHLGWDFLGAETGGMFYGLILDRLRSADR